MADIRTTAQIDDFNRADENPLSAGGAYRQLGGAGDVHQLQNLSNAAHGDVTSGRWYCFSCWQVQSFTGGFEIWAEVVGTANNNDGWTLSMFDTIGGAANNFNGYTFERYRALGPDGWRIFRWDNALATQIAGTTGLNFPAAGELMLFRAVGAVLEGWHSTDSGTNWTLTGSVTDATYRDNWYLTPGVRSDAANGPAWDAWGGGVYPPRNVQLPFLGVGP